MKSAKPKLKPVFPYVLKLAGKDTAWKLSQKLYKPTCTVSFGRDPPLPIYPRRWSLDESITKGSRNLRSSLLKALRSAKRVRGFYCDQTLTGSAAKFQRLCDRRYLSLFEKSSSKRFFEFCRHFTKLERVIYQSQDYNEEWIGVSGKIKNVSYKLETLERNNTGVIHTLHWRFRNKEIGNFPDTLLNFFNKFNILRNSKDRVSYPITDSLKKLSSMHLQNATHESLLVSKYIVNQLPYTSSLFHIGVHSKSNKRGISNELLSEIITMSRLQKLKIGNTFEAGYPLGVDTTMTDSFSSLEELDLHFIYRRAQEQHVACQFAGLLSQAKNLKKVSLTLHPPVLVEIDKKAVPIKPQAKEPLMKVYNEEEIALSFCRLGTNLIEMKIDIGEYKNHTVNFGGIIDHLKNLELLEVMEIKGFCLTEREHLIRLLDHVCLLKNLKQFMFDEIQQPIGSDLVIESVKRVIKDKQLAVFWLKVEKSLIDKFLLELAKDKTLNKHVKISRASPESMNFEALKIPRRSTYYSLNNQELINKLPV